MTNNLRSLEIEGHTTSTAHRLMHYDGACNNIHGHNMEWNATLKVHVPNEDHQMSVDFKDVSDVFEKYDHALLLNVDDPLLRTLENDVEEGGGKELAKDLLGEVYVFDGDPTTELLSRVVAQDLVDKFSNVERARVQIKETDKYGMSASVPDPL